MAEPPQILRIKRKRGQDPLQALILEDRQPAKRSKPSSPVSSQATTPRPETPKSWYFQLQRTDKAAEQDQTEIMLSVLAESGAKSEENRQFVIPKQQTEEDAVIPNELADMVDNFLHVDTNTQPRRKRRGGKVAETSEQPQTEVDIAGEYVFDVYRLTDVEPLTNANFPHSQIGYIKFFDDEQFALMHSDDEDLAKGILSDDEDSNAESFYQNDYPEDEDAGAYSDTYADEEDDYGIGPVILESSEAAEGHAYLKGEFQQEGQYDDLYEDFYGDGENVDFLQEDNYENDENFERQRFFDGEEDDDLAVHRDRIFGRLQRMINERD